MCVCVCGGGGQGHGGEAMGPKMQARREFLVTTLAFYESNWSKNLRDGGGGGKRVPRGKQREGDTANRLNLAS